MWEGQSSAQGPGKAGTGRPGDGQRVGTAILRGLTRHPIPSYTARAYNLDPPTLHNIPGVRYEGGSATRYHPYNPDRRSGHPWFSHTQSHPHGKRSSGYKRKEHSGGPVSHQVSQYKSATHVMFSAIGMAPVGLSKQQKQKTELVPIIGLVCPEANLFHSTQHSPGGGGRLRAVRCIVVS